MYKKEDEDQLVNEQNFDNYELGEVLGFGSYAIVRLATHKIHKLKVAVKTYEKIKL